LQQACNQEKRSIISYCEALIDEAPLQFPVKLTARQKQGLMSYIQLIRELRVLEEQRGLTELVQAVIEQSGYTDVLRADKETYEDRRENVDALTAKTAEGEVMSQGTTLSVFLEELSLKSSLGEASGKQDRVSLMTIHNGKGLEFKVTFLAGMEEDLFPHANSRDNPKQLEEERRLCYIGTTRARDLLYVTSCMQRFIWGITRTQRPSRFIKEIPFEDIEKIRRSTTSVTRKFKEEKEVPDVQFIDEVDQTAPDYDHPFVPGDAVFHKDFGVGIVRGAVEGSMGLTYKILFSKDNRERSIVARLTQLKKL